ncbi:MAG TPA: extradiol dioxygenase [Thalassospira sp.]|nr:extradiol dioxygenase [Thalassospira sp.]
MPHIGLCALIVRDYDDAIAFYTDKVGFDLIEDTDMGDGKRWVIVAPTGATETRILLARASGADQENAIGNQTGGRVGFFLNTDDFARDHARMTKAGVRFLEAPRHEPYGTVAVFEDLYGNKWDLLELALQ